MAILINVISLILITAIVLSRVILFTLLERKILSYSQARLGPNKISVIGLVQPLLDGIKLMVNEKPVIARMNKFLFYSGPFVVLIVIIFFWMTVPLLYLSLSIKYPLLFIIICFGISVYRNLFRGWSSNSKFSSLGAFRGLSQTISYELTLIFILLSIFLLFNSLSIYILEFLSTNVFGILTPIFTIWIINILAETGRAPLDFIEGESELVSGFNTEFSSRRFALLFVGEYGLVIYFSVLTPFLFNSGGFTNIFWSFLILLFYLICRTSFPRFRYDFLIDLAWKKLLPFIIFYLYILLSLRILC